MKYAIVLITCSLMLVTMLSTSPGAIGIREEILTKKGDTKKGKLKGPHRVPVIPGTPLILYFHSTNLADTVDKEDVTATYLGYTLTCTDATVVDDNSTRLLRVTFSVVANVLASGQSVPKKNSERGTGDLTVTLNTQADGSNPAPKIAAFGE
jgi:hypothetical protein